MEAKVRTDNVATFIKELVLQLPEGESVPFKAGGYIQIERPAGLLNTKTLTWVMNTKRTGTILIYGNTSLRLKRQ